MDERHVEKPAGRSDRDRGTDGLGAEVLASALLIALAVLATLGVALLAHLLLKSGS